MGLPKSRRVLCAKYIQVDTFYKIGVQKSKGVLSVGGRGLKNVINHSGLPRFEYCFSSKVIFLSSHMKKKEQKPTPLRLSVLYGTFYLLIAGTVLSILVFVLLESRLLTNLAGANSVRKLG